MQAQGGIVLHCPRQKGTLTPAVLQGVREKVVNLSRDRWDVMCFLIPQGEAIPEPSTLQCWRMRVGCKQCDGTESGISHTEPRRLQQLAWFSYKTLAGTLQVITLNMSLKMKAMTAGLPQVFSPQFQTCPSACCEHTGLPLLLPREICKTGFSFS